MAKHKGGQPPKIDWSIMREEYVTGDDRVTLVALAEKHGVARETASRRKTREDWDSQRAQYRHQVVTKTRERASSYEAARLVKLMKVGEAMRGVALGQLEKLRVPVEVMRDGKLVTISRLEESMSVSEVRQWLTAACAIEKEAIGSEQEVEVRLRVELQGVLDLLRAGLTDAEYLKVVSIVAAGQPAL